MSSEKAEVLCPSKSICRKAIDGSEGVTAASVDFLEMWEAVSLTEHRGRNVVEA